MGVSCLTVRNFSNCRYRDIHGFLIPSQEDQLVGAFLLFVAVVVFVYYTLWVLVVVGDYPLRASLGHLFQVYGLSLRFMNVT